MFTVHDFSEPGMPPRAIVATREDAAAADDGLGIAPSNLHVEMLATIDDMKAALARMEDHGAAPLRRRWPTPAVHPVAASAATEAA